MKRLIGAAILFILSSLPCMAASEGWVVPTCPASLTTPYTMPGFAAISVDPNGNQCIVVSVSASITGFTPNGNFATLTSAGTSGSVALPAGTTVAFQNTGTTTVSCTLGVGSAVATANEIQVPASSTVFVTPGSNTFGACIDQTGSTSNTIVLAGGSGLGTGFGGGGGGGGSSGAVFGPTAVGSANANPPVVIGGTVTGAAGQNVEGVAVKPASTAPLATDFALVTVESPNSPVVSALNTASLCQGLSAEQAAVTTANPQKIMCDLIGKLVTSPYANRELMARGAVTLSGTSAGTILAASGSASLKEYVTDLTCTRNDAGTTAVSITLNDTATTVIDLPNNGGGGGYAHTFNVPLAFAANVAATATSGTSITSIHCSATGFYGY